MTALVAAKLGISAEQVLVASTGVIGVPLPMAKIRGSVKIEVERARVERRLEAAKGEAK